MRVNIKHAFMFSLSILTLILFFINFGYYSIKYDNTFMGIKPLIVDFDCLENQNKGKDCTYPIAVAIPDGYPQMSNEFIEIKFTLDISENSKDFWLFKNVDNSTNLIATRR
uniref:W02B3.4-like N-terminal domain-containing protein n=1 Tax=Meloidogyne javanica TaxID=6303 RepID=A0A915LP56_MELJA